LSQSVSRSKHIYIASHADDEPEAHTNKTTSANTN